MTAFSATANNRLMRYETDSTAGGQTTAISTVFYCYNAHGNVTTVTRKWENPPAGVMPYRTTQFVYARNQQAVTHVVGVDWDASGTTNCLYARGFRYDEARQRYLVREYDPDLLPQLANDLLGTMSLPPHQESSLPHLGAAGLS